MPEKEQLDLFRLRLVDFIDMNHELVSLFHSIDGIYLSKALSVCYSSSGAPFVPIRLMVVCYLLLKHLYSLGDDHLPEYWVRDVYFQYFCCGIFLNTVSYLTRSILFIFANAWENQE